MAGKQDLNGRNVLPLPPQTRSQGNTVLVNDSGKAADKWDNIEATDKPPKKKLNRIEMPVFHRLKWSDPQLGTLSALPDELVVKILKHLTPPEVPGIVWERSPEGFGGSRSNILHFMQASSKLYKMARELKCLKERTYHFAIWGMGCSFEGHRACPSEIIKAAMKHVNKVKVIVEIDLDGLSEYLWCKALIKACQKVSNCMQHLNEHGGRLQTYDIEVHILDSLFGSVSPLGVTVDERRDHMELDQLLRNMLAQLIQVQNIQVGNVQLMCQPLTYHPKWNCSLPPMTPHLSTQPYKARLARKRWCQLQRLLGAAAYLLSGWDKRWLQWCTEYLDMGGFTGYDLREELWSNKEHGEWNSRPLYDNVFRNFCICGQSCSWS